jgi:toxin YoeB
VEVIYLQQALDDLSYWKKSGNRTIQNKISKLIKSIEETPYEGIGKPEALKYHHSGKWSRRITKADRLIYEIEDNKVFIYSLKRSLR